MKISPVILEEELNKSFARQNFSYNETCVAFLHEPPENLIDENNNFYGMNQRCLDHSQKHNGNMCIPAKLLAKIITEKAVKKSFYQFEVYLNLVFGFSYVAIPYITIHLQDRSFLPTEFFFVIYVLINTIVSFYLSWTFVLHVYTGIFDARRKLYCMQQMTILLDQNKMNRYFLDIPQVTLFDMSDHNTIDNWYQIRSSLLDFGKQYQTQVAIYVSMVFPLSLGITGMIILDILSITTDSANRALVSMLFLTIVSFIPIIYIIVAGTEINRLFSVHVDMLLNISGKFLGEAKNNQEDSKKINRTIKLLGHIIQKLDQDKDLKPFKFLWVKADWMIFAKVVAVLISGALAFYQTASKYTQKNYI